MVHRQVVGGYGLQDRGICTQSHERTNAPKDVEGQGGQPYTFQERGRPKRGPADRNQRIGQECQLEPANEQRRYNFADSGTTRRGDKKVQRGRAVDEFDSMASCIARRG